jgi:hypothetical protein
MNDLRFACHQLARSPGFTTISVISLALGIGIGTAVFSLVNAILLRSLSVPNPHELRVVHWTGTDVRMSSYIGNFFSGLGVRPFIGRLLTDSEDNVGGAMNAVIDHDKWQRCFNHVPEALGRTVVLDGTRFTVVGVLPRGFAGVEPGISPAHVAGAAGARSAGTPYGSAMCGLGARALPSAAAGSGQFRCWWRKRRVPSRRMPWPPWKNSRAVRLLSPSIV